MTKIKKENGFDTMNQTGKQRPTPLIYDILLQTHGEQRCFLNHTSPFELLIATILSAQCTDKTVNLVTPALFARYPDAKSMAKAKLEDVEQIIHPCGFYHAKAKHIIEASRAIAERFGGKVPNTMEDLTSLPGTGRKTANVVLGDAFGVPGFPVDTHVKRLSNLLGLVKTDDPAKIEEKLCRKIEPEKWAQFSHLLIIHGRTRCVANRPQCDICELKSLCKHAKSKKKG